MFAISILICSIAFAESKTFALQVCLDRAGYSCNVIDGQWGRKSQNALERYCSDRRLEVPRDPETACDALFSGAEDLFRVETVTQEDLDAIVTIPREAAGKAALSSMGYESIAEMFAERGHVSIRALERLNPGVDWKNIQAGLKLVIPNFPSMSEELAAGDRSRPHAPKRPRAAKVIVSLSRFEVLALDAAGRTIGLFPCSIAKNKEKLPPHGELKVTSYVANPNYTYTPDFTPKGKKAMRYVFPPGPNCPVGIAWMGLNLPGYGLHGSPHPETIGHAESHGCFRLANWNAARLYGMSSSGMPVVVEQ